MRAFFLAFMLFLFAPGALISPSAVAAGAGDRLQFSEAKLKALDAQETEILKRADAGQLERRTIDDGLSLAETHLRTQSGDPYQLLSALRSAVQLDTSDLTLVGRLGRAYLAVDLPWDAVSILEPVADKLDKNAKETLQKGRLALKIIHADAVAVAPGSDLYRDVPTLGVRLLDLLGVPPLYQVGPYGEFTHDMQKRRAEGDSAGQKSQAELERAIGGPPLLTLMLGGAPAQSFQDQVAARTTELPPLRLGGADRTALAPLMQRARAAPAGSEIALSSAERALVVRLAGGTGRDGKKSEPLVLKRGAAFRGSLTFLFQVGSEAFAEKGRALIVAEGRDGGPQAFLFETFNPAAIRAIDSGPAGAQHIVISAQRVRSDSPLDLDVFDPASGRLWNLAKEAYHGAYRVLSMGASKPPVIVVSMSTRDRRFGDCNQCPARRLAWLVRYDREAHDYHTVAERRTGADLSARTNQNFLGMSPEMLAFGLSYADISAPLARLSGRSPVYLRKKFKEDVGVIVQHVTDVHFKQEQFADAVVVLRRMVEQLSRDGDVPQVRDARALAQILLVQALFLAGDVAGAAAITQDPRVEADFANDTNFLNIASLVAMATGDYARSERLLTAWRNVKQESASEGTFARFLGLVGDQESARTIGLTALYFAVREQSDSHVAIDMIQLAETALRRRNEEEALDWLSRALRITRGLRNSELDAFALQIAADIALQNRLPRVALLFLDQAVIATSEVTWATNGAPILLLYGQALEQLQDAAAADLSYSVASDLAGRDRGSVYVSAQSLRARLAERRGDRQGALHFATDAFRAVLDGRSRVGRESYKLSFIATSRTVAEQYLELRLVTGALAAELLGDIEAWRLQVFKDIYGGQLGAELAPGLIADRLAKTLKAHEVYVAFTIRDTQSFAIVVTPQGSSIVRLTVSRTLVQRDLEQLRRWLDPDWPKALDYINRKEVPAELETSLRSLHDAFIAPLPLPPGTAVLLVSPDEASTSVPWSALLQPRGPRDSGQLLHPLAERVATVVVPSAQLLLREATPIRDEGSRGIGLIGAFGGVTGARLASSSPVIRGENATADLPELKHGLKEIVAIAQAMKGRPISLLLDSATLAKRQTLPTSSGVASRAAALALLPAASMIHIAGHARFNALAPMQSRIFLDVASDSALSAEDLAHVDLSRAQLIVLSACETARGQVVTGVETFGILRGLMGAGARSVILTHWSVDDEATSDLFAAFYRGFAQRKGAAEALRIAQMEIFRKRSHPFYWAAPTVFGWWR